MNVNLTRIETQPNAKRMTPCTHPKTGQTKVAHLNRTDAEHAMTRLIEKHRREGCEGKSEGLHVYQCDSCHQFHVGHAQPPEERSNAVISTMTNRFASAATASSSPQGTCRYCGAHPRNGGSVCSKLRCQRLAAGKPVRRYRPKAVTTSTAASVPSAVPPLNHEQEFRKIVCARVPELLRKQELLAAELAVVRSEYEKYVALRSILAPNADRASEGLDAAPGSSPTVDAAQ